MQVHLRSGSRKPAHLEQQAQPRLHRGLRPRFGQRDRPAGLHDAVGTPARGDELLQCRQVDQAARQRLVQRDDRVLKRQPAGEVEAGSQRARHREPLSPDHLGRVEIFPPDNGRDTFRGHGRGGDDDLRSSASWNVETMEAGRDRAGEGESLGEASRDGDQVRGVGGGVAPPAVPPLAEAPPGRPPQLSLRDAGGPRLGDRERATSKLLRYPASPCHATSVARPAMPANPPCNAPPPARRRSPHSAGKAPVSERE